MRTQKATAKLRPTEPEFYHSEARGITYQRCPHCWRFLDLYPHYDNGFRLANKRYTHKDWCPNYETW